MTTHIGAKVGDIAERVLLPGDPLRAQFIAKEFFDSAVCYNEIRGMYGFTGLYKGQRVSVQGTGMGIPSISIYTQELMQDYGVKTLVRVGTCGAMQAHLQVRDVILAMAASTDSAVNRIRFPHVDYAPTADFSLLSRAYAAAKAAALSVHVGSVYTSDTFYNEDDEIGQRLTKYGVLAVEMETTALYTLAARFQAQALAILTVSDHLITGEQTSPEQRQTSFRQMIELALDTVVQEG
ncbi:MAG: purine-nucleoside phosphorylase [Firmicutes bacterium]|nr:purine-nucleoside phosphorylase [Bacillota bacterium]